MDDKIKRSLSSRLELIAGDLYPNHDFAFLEKLTKESDRGAVLIGVSHVEEYLEYWIRKILPDTSKKYTSRLLNYPGVLNSFAGKIELLYAFRIMDEKLYNSLNALRKIRNTAAHSSTPFHLKHEKKDLLILFDFSDSSLEFITEYASESTDDLFRHDLYLKNIKDKQKPNFEEQIDGLLKNMKDEEVYQKTLQIRELSSALVFMCFYIVDLCQKFEKLNLQDLNWMSIMSAGSKNGGIKKTAP